MSGELIDTTEMYLRTIFELQEEGVPALRARIAERLGQSGPTVSQTVARMERDGLLKITTERRLVLTEVGAQQATRVMRKHRLAERLLVDILGLQWSDVHEEACRWEHVMSDQVERRIMEILGHPTTSPYGNPIPGLHELFEDASDSDADQAQSVAILLADVGASAQVTLARFGEPIQRDAELMSHFVTAGLQPGCMVSATRKGDEICFSGPNITPITVRVGVARQLFVTTVTSENPGI